MPYERLHKSTLGYDHIKVFGNLCYAHDQARKGDKFAALGRKCMFVGCPYGKKGWRSFDFEKNDFFVSRDVIFFEEEFPL